jgi:plastocyanin
MIRHLTLAAALVVMLGQGLTAAALTGRVEVRTAQGLRPSTTVVFAEALDRAAPPRPTKVSLGQRDKTFAPGVLVVPVGSTVDFPNDDPIFHNVFSLSAPGPFDLGLYRAGSTKSRTFSKAGSYRIFCNIHPQMSAFILVVPTPYVTTADAEGRYTLDLPPGTYRLTARTDRAEPVSVEVTVGAGALAAPNLTLDESDYIAAPHKNKFGQDYPLTAYEGKGGR